MITNETANNALKDKDWAPDRIWVAGGTVDVKTGTGRLVCIEEKEDDAAIEASGFGLKL